MRYLVSAEEMQALDRATIERIGIPGMVLMERAALAAAERVLSLVGEKRNAKVLILAGMGNNGGDGLALARLLSERRMQVTVWCVGDETRASEQWRMQRHMIEYYPVRVVSDAPEGDYDILVDALFGVGLSREITGDYADAVACFNRMTGCKLALDVPSGICSDTGKILGCVVRADETVTFGFATRGLYLFPGCMYAGQVRLADVGITTRAFGDVVPHMFATQPEDLARLLPVRRADGNKGTFGKVLLIAGSKGMAGAAVLGARAAYRVGAGMVKVLSDEGNRQIIQQSVPEALFGTYAELGKSLDWADVIAMGPGMSVTEEAGRCLRTVLETCWKPLLIDADGLNLLAADASLQDLLAARDGVCILTPHMGEFSRLCGLPIKQLKERTWEHGCALAKRLRCVVVVKDARTFVCGIDGTVCMNLYGNDGMATAGSGDVLAGILSGLLAQAAQSVPEVGSPQEVYMFDTVCAGVYVHAAAGDAVRQERGRYGCMAGDIAEQAAAVLRQI